MRPVCVFAGVGSGEEDQKVGQAIIMAYHGGETERVEGDEAKKRLMCAEIGEMKYEEMFENELLMHMDLERILEKQANVWPEYYWQIIRLFYEEEMSLVEISEKLRIPQGTIRNAHYRIRRCIRSYFDA